MLTGSSNKTKIGVIVGVVGGLVGILLLGGVLFFMCKSRLIGYKREVYVDVAGSVVLSSSFLAYLFLRLWFISVLDHFLGISLVRLSEVLLSIFHICAP